MQTYKFRFNGRVLKFNAASVQDGVNMLGRWLYNRYHRAFKLTDHIEVKNLGDWTALP